MISTLFLLSSLSDLYPDSNPIASVSYYNGKDNFVYVKDSSFHQLSMNLKGGAISIEPIVFTKVFLESSLFDSCYSGTGGAISLTLKTTIGVEKVCAFNCYASSNGQFGYFGLETLQTGNFQLFSMTKCSPSSVSGRSGGMDLYYGNFSMMNCNYSVNQAGSVSVFRIVARYAEISHITVSDNSAASTDTINIQQTSTTAINIRYMVFINNQAANYHMTVQTKNITYISYSIFYGNINPLFYTAATNYERLVICDSYIFHSYALYTYLTVGTTNVTFGDKAIETYKFNHYSTFLCFNMNINDLLQNLNFACTPAPSIPPPPTDCEIETAMINNVKTFTGFLGFIALSSLAFATL